MVFVVDSATRKARLTSDAAIALSQHGQLARRSAQSHVYASSALDGPTVSEADPAASPRRRLPTCGNMSPTDRVASLQACKQRGWTSGRQGGKQKDPQGGIENGEAAGQIGRFQDSKREGAVPDVQAVQHPASADEAGAAAVQVVAASDQPAPSTGRSGR